MIGISAATAAGLDAAIRAQRLARLNETKGSAMKTPIVRDPRTAAQKEIDKTHHLLHTITHLQDELKKARENIESLITWGDEIIETFVPRIPEKNCSCHISPPCCDCVDNEYHREVISNWEDTKRRST